MTRKRLRVPNAIHNLGALAEGWRVRLPCSACFDGLVCFDCHIFIHPLEITSYKVAKVVWGSSMESMARYARAYAAQGSSALTSNPLARVCLALVVMSLMLLVTRRMVPVSILPSFTLLSDAKGEKIRALTWNIAAVNNNPFEYWITNEDPIYNNLMKKVSDFIQKPGDNDVFIKKIITDDMFTELEQAMRDAGWLGVDETRQMWLTDYKNRRSISGFMKDDVIGKKRLASMPDRVTNTINAADGSVITRPTVINCYSGDLGSMQKFWTQWIDFVFKKEVTLKKKGQEVNVKIRDMITPIKKSKYPAITEEEEKISIPLQVLCAAIFDAILVNMLNTLEPAGWQPLREDMCNKLNRHKLDRTIQILETSYADSDVVFLQEVAGAFSGSANKAPLGAKLFDVFSPSTMDGDRDQNSFILLKKDKYTAVKELTSEVLAELKANSGSKPAPVMNGDIIALSATHIVTKTKYLLASFHGDTNGLATIPVVTAVRSYAQSKQPDHKLLFGMDANTYARPEADQQGVTAFAEFYVANKLNTCYGPHPNPLNFTTFHARTHLQTQLNKAVSLEEKDSKGDKNPKDFILFFAADFNVLSTSKDNTGVRKYVENMVFPTLVFPSDHGITATVLQEVATSGGGPPPNPQAPPKAKGPGHEWPEEATVPGGEPGQRQRLRSLKQRKTLHRR